MLTTTPLASPQVRPVLPRNRTALPGRRRGGQPGNSNAFRHGFYSSTAPQPGSAFFRTSPKAQEAFLLPATIKRGWITALKYILDENRLRLLDIGFITAGRLSFEKRTSCLRAAARVAGSIEKATLALHELGGRQEHLRSLARRMPLLLNRGFERHGITARPIFVPLELGNLHANLGWEPHRLTAVQWLLLQETFDTLHVELDSSRKYRRRKPLPSDRILLEGILWKLAGGLRWQDLRGKYPVRLCQELYSVLCRTGSMQAIFNHLHWHLNVYGEASLAELVERGCFEISGNRVLLSPSEELTWEKYTALVLLQQACHARRSIRREETLEPRCRGIFYRQPAIRLPKSTRRPARPSSPPPSPPASIPMQDTLQSILGPGGRDLPQVPGLVSLPSPHPISVGLTLRGPPHLCH